jgi:signal transduction histidine kinase
MVGTGVGLYLVKIVVAMHQGDVAVESREGEGSTFTVRLPVRNTASEPSASADHEDTVGHRAAS